MSTVPRSVRKDFGDHDLSCIKSVPATTNLLTLDAQREMEITQTSSAPQIDLDEELECVEHAGNTDVIYVSDVLEPSSIEVKTVKIPSTRVAERFGFCHRPATPSPLARARSGTEGKGKLSLKKQTRIRSAIKPPVWQP